MNDKFSLQSRRYDIDWLRLIATLTIFLFHCARFFNEEDWHVKNNTLDFGMSVFVAILAQWVMPLFFVLSAYSAWYALGNRSNKQFVLERVKRLLVPFLFGVFTLIPPQVYIERLSHGQFEGSLIAFVPHYFDGWYGFGGNFAWMGLHLWYLLMLFIFSLLLLPLLQALKASYGRKAMSWLARLLAYPGIVLLLAAPLAGMEALVNTQPDSIGIRSFGGWSPLSYLMIFILGYVLASDERYRKAIEKQRLYAIGLAVLLTALGTWMVVATGESEYSLLFSFIRGFNTWSWLLAILGYGSAYLDFNRPFLHYTNDVTLPFYILHQTIIVIVAYNLIDWQTGVLLKFFVLAAVSFAIISSLVHLVVRPYNPLRLLFGMRPKPMEPY